MKNIDRDGLMLCELQGKIFEKSVDEYPSSSPIFIRRYMNSDLCSMMDSVSFLDRPFEAEEAFGEIDEEYGKTKYGSVRYTKEEMFWIGYIYRYWAYTHEVSSRNVYKTIAGRELVLLYYAYHTLDPKNAISRILESKGLDSEVDYMTKGVELMRKYRGRIK